MIIDKKDAENIVECLKELRQWVEDGIPADWIRSDWPEPNQYIPRIGHICKRAKEATEKMEDKIKGEG